MGLDVDLYRYDDHEKSVALSDKYERESDAIWNSVCGDAEYKDIPRDLIEQVRVKSKALAESLGLGEWGEANTGEEQIEENSATDPKHMFKIGYFRSSYNSAGTDHVLDACCGWTLGRIFDTDGDQYHLQPDWAACLDRCKQAIADFEAKIEADGGLLFCEFIGVDRYPQPPSVSSEEEAIAAYRERVAESRTPDPFGGDPNVRWFSSTMGSFYLGKPIEVVALITNVDHSQRTWRGSGFYMITKSGEGKWYLDALKIVQETIEYVLAQPDKEKFWLHWSG